MDEAELLSLLGTLEPGAATTRRELEEMIRLRRAAAGPDGVARVLLAVYAQADRRQVCENVLEALSALYSSEPGEPERFPSEQVQRLYGETLLAALSRDTDPAVRVNAIINLRGEDHERLGARLTEALARALRADSSAVRYRAALQLIEFDREAALGLLLGALSDPLCRAAQDSPEGQCSAVWDILMALDQYGAEPALAPRVIEAVTRVLWQVRPTELGYLDIWKAADTLAAHLGHPQLVFHHLAALARHPDWRVRESVAHALEHLPITGEQLSQLLLTLAQDREPEVAAEARLTYRIVRGQ